MITKGGDKVDLKSKREKNNLTQQELADLIKMDRTLISKIESGVSAPSVNTAKKIAEVLGFDWTLFFTDDNAADTMERFGINS